MELSINTTNLENANQILEENMKKKSRTLPSSLRKSLIILINKHSNLVTVKGKKIILSTQFYPTWVKEHKLDKDTEIVDSEHYNFFRKLRKYGYIHTNSSYFPKKLAVITLNPTIPSLYEGNMRYISRYTKAKKSLYHNKSRKMDLPEMMSLAFIDLRLFQNIKFTEKEIESINTSNIIFINKSTAYLYLEDQGIFDNMTIPPYQMICVQGKKLVKILKEFQKNGIIYPFDSTDFNKQLSPYRQEFFQNMSMQEIRYTSKNYIFMSSSPLFITLATSRKIMSPLTIAELHSLYPSAIPQHLIEIEAARISEALARTKGIDDEDTFTDSSFSLEEFDYFNELLKTKNSSAFMKKIQPAKRELSQYADSPKSEAHGILIVKYIVHLLSSVDKQNEDRYIAISTFRNYYSLIKKHLFQNIEDLSNVQTHEINEILQNLAINRYKDKSIAKVRSLISDFFKFHGEKHNTISMNLASYPKSLVFEFEIDPILRGIDDSYKDEKNGVITDYRILRNKAIVLISRYTGLRKSELRSRLVKDIYIYGNELCIDVNKEGLRKLDLKLKTASAKRRVCTKITNENHLQIIIKYIGKREKVCNKNLFLFLHVDEKNNIKSKVVKEDIFNQIGKIIQEVTARYTSFHSLRHTFATYAVKEILECEKINPYKMINLAVKMGHTSSEITLKKYTHRSAIECILTNKDKK